MDKRESINEVVLECVLENEDAIFLNVVSPDLEGYCRVAPTCLRLNADVHVLAGSAR